MVDINDDWIWEEATTYDEDEPETYEELNERISRCGKSASIYTDNHGHSGYEQYFCHSNTCPICLGQRVKRKTKELKYLDSEDYVHARFLDIKTITPEDMTSNRKQFYEVRDNLRALFPTLWYKLYISPNHILISLKKEDYAHHKEIIPETITYNQLVLEYVDWTSIKSDDTKESLLIEYKGKRRMLYHGANPEIAPTACNRSVAGFSLKRTDKTLLNENEFKTTKLPKCEYQPIEKLKYIVEPLPLSGQKEPQTIDFKTFLNERITGNYLDEWEQYHGNLESDRMQKYLVWLLKVNPGVYGFLKEQE